MLFVNMPPYRQWYTSAIFKRVFTLYISQTTNISYEAALLHNDQFFAPQVLEKERKPRKMGKYEAQKFAQNLPFLDINQIFALL